MEISLGFDGARQRKTSEKEEEIEKEKVTFISGIFGSNQHE